MSIITYILFYYFYISPLFVSSLKRKTHLSHHIHPETLRNILTYINTTIKSGLCTIHSKIIIRILLRCISWYGNTFILKNTKTILVAVCYAFISSRITIVICLTLFSQMQGDSNFIHTFVNRIRTW